MTDHPAGGQPLLVTDPENLAELRRSGVTLKQTLGLLNSSWRQQLRHNSLVDERLKRLEKAIADMSSTLDSRLHSIQGAIASLASSVNAFADQVASRDIQRNVVLEEILAKPGNPQ